MNSPSPKVNVDHRSDIRPIKACNQGIDNGQMGGIPGGVNPHRMLGTTAHGDKFPLTYGCNTTLSPGLVDELPTLQRIDMSGGFSVDKVEEGFIKFISISVHFLGFPIGFLCRISTQNGILNRPASILCLLRQIVNPVAAANRPSHFPGIGCRQSDHLSVFVQIRHFHIKAIAVRPNRFNILFYDSFCFLLHTLLIPLSSTSDSLSFSFPGKPGEAESSYFTACHLRISLLPWSAHQFWHGGVRHWRRLGPRRFRCTSEHREYALPLHRSGSEQRRHP